MDKHRLRDKLRHHLSTGKGKLDAFKNASELAKSKQKEMKHAVAEAVMQPMLPVKPMEFRMVIDEQKQYSGLYGQVFEVGW